MFFLLWYTIAMNKKYIAIGLLILGFLFMQGGRAHAILKPQLPQMPKPIARCSIGSFRVGTGLVQKGQGTVMIWTTSGCSSVTIDGAPVKSMGTITTGALAATKSYTLKAKGSVGDPIQKTVTVTVDTLPAPAAVPVTADSLIGITTPADGQNFDSLPYNALPVTWNYKKGFPDDYKISFTIQGVDASGKLVGPTLPITRAVSDNTQKIILQYQGLMEAVPSIVKFRIIATSAEDRNDSIIPGLLIAKGDALSHPSYFTISSAPVSTPFIIVTSPNGGESFSEKQTIPVSWKTSGISSGDLVSFYIDVYDANGNIATTVPTGVNNAMASAGAASVTIPLIPRTVTTGTNYYGKHFMLRAILLKASGAPYLNQDWAVEDSSDNLFSIGSAPTVAVTDPAIIIDKANIVYSPAATANAHDIVTYKIPVSIYSKDTVFVGKNVQVASSIKGRDGSVALMFQKAGTDVASGVSNVVVLTSGDASSEGGALKIDAGTRKHFTITATLTGNGIIGAYRVALKQIQFFGGPNVDMPMATVSMPIDLSSLPNSQTAYQNLVKGDAVSQSSVPALIQTLGRGIIGDDGVKSLQSALRQSGFLPASAAIDGSYGRLTERAVKDYQKQNGLPVTGTADQMLFNRIVAGE